MYVRCDACPRYVELMLTSDVPERQVGRTTFSCVVCGAAGALTGDDPAARPGTGSTLATIPAVGPAAVARIVERRHWSGPAF